ncbi:helix-turn-helix domain-containing protein [Novosphingobium sp.]|uniref:winged helix-turn-helix transcriptional regulator n=1 Tax=Novosphingobium sp. TaxID=1874826 RepID=UPI0031E03152
MTSADIVKHTDVDAASAAAMLHIPQFGPVLDKIPDKWMVMIFTVICLRPARFTEIKRRLDGISHKAWSDALKCLERHGLVSRTVLPTQPIGVEYAIAPLGHSLRQPFEALCAWAFDHGPAVDAAVVAFGASRDREAA